MLPPGILDLRKRGFGIPLGKWLRKDLAGVLKETLLDRSFMDRGIVRKDAMAGLVNDHLSGIDDHRHRLWALLVLARWLESSH
jgi:asparagine synthase (glutamine-hydrolysing)